MHIGDGLLSWTWPIYYVFTILALYFALRWAKKNLDEKHIPLLAVMAAGIFAIQAMNIPIPWGTSGHMIGAALVAIVFGSPWAAVLVLSMVLIVQGFFGDGGITALGANIFDMGVIGGFVGFGVFKGLNKIIGRYPAIFIAGWASIFIAALAVAIELAIAGTFPLDLGLFYMGLYHAVIGLAEGAITVIAILAIQNVRPDLLPWGKKEAVQTDVKPPKPEVAK